MRILYVTDGGAGGVSSHVRCLTQCLKGAAEIMVCITQKSDALRQMLDEDGTPYYLCNCTSGHDLKLFFAIRHIVKKFKPDVIHLHDIRLFALLYLRYFTNIHRVCSIHLPSNPRQNFTRRVVNWAAQPCYWLPVSNANWERFRAYHPGVEGEAFLNPVRIQEVKRLEISSRADEHLNKFIVGMVGRFAEVKDWPSFCVVAETASRLSSQFAFWGVGVSADESRSFGSSASSIEWKGLQANGREWIAKMDLLMLTSVSEEMPTVVLEAFQARTPVCGFIPEGGMSDILSFSNGALREVFIDDRDSERLSRIVLRMKEDCDLRRRVVEDGWQILVNHFDAEKNCRGRLMDIYHQWSRTSLGKGDL